MSISLFSPWSQGSLSLSNRVVMAPMTRSRALGNVPNELMAAYYAQRSEAGLIVTEGTSPSPDGLGYARIPGLFTAEHVAGWKRVTDAVHRAGSRIFVQLMHTGRVGHPDNLPAGARVVGPSAVAWESQMWVDGKGQLPVPVAHALTEAEIEATIAQYVRSAELAVEAGFDGVELHGANGYLIEQFFNTAANQRSDRWGGSVENRARFGLEIARRTAAKIGANRVAMRVSPYGANGGMKSNDDQVEALHELVAAELQKLGAAYLHVVDHSSLGAPPVPAALKARLRQVFTNTLILAGGYDREKAEAALTAGQADLIAFGRPFIANPRLPTLLKTGGALAAVDFGTAYTPGAQGYTDYPVVP